MNLEDGILSAQQQPLAWTRERSSEILRGVRRKRETHARRERMVWRGLALGSGVGILLALGQVTTHSIGARVDERPRSAESALLTMSDAGYERD